jgi:hypothetical protein
MLAKVTKIAKPTCEHISQIDQVNHVTIMNNWYATRFQFRI